MNALTLSTKVPSLVSKDSQVDRRCTSDPFFRPQQLSALEDSQISSLSGLQARPPYQLTEYQRQHQLYLQQLQLMQRRQVIPGGTALPWHTTFSPANTPACSDNTILLENSQRCTLISNSRLNKQPVGPHWRSVWTVASTSATSSPPPSSPRLPSHQHMCDTLTASSDDHFRHRTDFTAAVRAARETTSLPSSPLASSPASFPSSSSSSSVVTSMDIPSQSSLGQLSPGLEQGMSMAQGMYAKGGSQDGLQQPSQYSNKMCPSALTRCCSQHVSNPTNLGSPYRRGMKRKADWKDKEFIGPSSPWLSLSTLSVSGASNLVLKSESTSACLMQQFVPTVSAQGQGGTSQVSEIPRSQHPVDNSMLNLIDNEAGYQSNLGSVVTTPMGSNCGRMSVDVSTANSVNQNISEDGGGECENGNGRLSQGRGPLQVKRSKLRLGMVAPNDGRLSEIETKSQESGQRTLDIFQECFYNASAAPR
ncbi:hypothetical protein EDD21DRAFT_233605 [Dissophora ornata]|nr:hypothetical protein BGZ58_011256 [Dissophora ornata]KAI8606399.1 hypothetical protein EDD21DRAFT_233605 [Dissophora ornata]